MLFTGCGRAPWQPLEAHGLLGCVLGYGVQWRLLDRCGLALREVELLCCGCQCAADAAWAFAAMKCRDEKLFAALLLWWLCLWLL